MFPENRYWRCRRDVQRQCSTVGQQRPEKLGCVGQQAMMSTKSGVADEPRQQMTDGVPQQGTVWCRHLYTKTASLNLMCSGTVSQCNYLMWSYLDAESTNRIVEFNTDCILLVSWDGMPASGALPQSIRYRTRGETKTCRTKRGTERRILRSWRRIAKQAATVFETCHLIDISTSM